MKYQESLDLFAEACRLIPGGSQTRSKSPTMFALGAYPIYVRSSEGCRVTDVDGNTYIDLVGGLGPVILGYRYPAVDQAIQAQLQEGILSGLLFPAEVEAARIMHEMVPCAEMVRFFKGGGEATAAAARIARAFTGREVILNSGYRGWPDVWAAANNDGGVPKALEAVIEAFPFGDLEALERLLEKHKGQVAAVFLDILREEPADGYLQAVHALCRKHGALFVMDEIVTGFRMADGGAQECYDVVPDLACFAKGMANGMPISAVAGRADVMKTTERLAMSITYGGEALSLAAAVATMSTIRDEPVVPHLWDIGQQLQDGLNQVAEKAGVPFQCDGIPCMSTMSFRELDAGQTKLTWTFFLQEMARRGVLMRRGGVNFMNYSHQPEDVRIIVDAASEVLGELRTLWKSDELERRVQAKEIGELYRAI